LIFINPPAIPFSLDRITRNASAFRGPGSRKRINRFGTDKFYTLTLCD